MQVRICPECGAEYFAHIAECADCGVPLGEAGPERGRGRERGSTPAQRIAGPVTAVREGSREWLEELSDALLAEGIPASMALAPGCTAGSCGARYILSVPFDRVGEAGVGIEEYLRRVHPELREAFEREREGMCPACGARLAEDARECSECGLLIVIEAEG